MCENSWNSNCVWNHRKLFSQMWNFEWRGGGFSFSTSTSPCSFSLKDWLCWLSICASEFHKYRKIEILANTPEYTPARTRKAIRERCYCAVHCGLHWKVDSIENSVNEETLFELLKLNILLNCQTAPFCTINRVSVNSIQNGNEIDFLLFNSLKFHSLSNKLFKKNRIKRKTKGVREWN